VVVPFRLCRAFCRDRAFYRHRAQFFLGRRHAGLLERVVVQLDDPFPDRVVAPELLRVVVHPGLLRVVVLGLPLVELFRRLVPLVGVVVMGIVLVVLVEFLE